MSMNSSGVRGNSTSVECRIRHSIEYFKKSRQGK
ncbi:hypothetical protein D0267_05625 [Vibrio alginolyticus]|nr:hypothetical protein [Vibrio alginolyticus]